MKQQSSCAILELSAHPCCTAKSIISQMIPEHELAVDHDPVQRARWQQQARHFESKVHFNQLCGIRVSTWTNESVVMHLPHAEQLCNSTNGFHGGVIAALADTCGTAA